MCSADSSSKYTPRPRVAASVSVVRSSAVGPRPPVAITRSAWSSPLAKAQRIRSASSPTVITATRSTPISKSLSARKLEFVSTVRPEVSSSPVERMTAFSITCPPVRILGVPHPAGKQRVARGEIDRPAVPDHSAGMGRVVCLSFPLATGPNEVERVRAIHPAIEVVAAPYIEDEGRRQSRHQLSSDALRADAPPLTKETRRAFERAEVVLALDVPVGLADFARNLRWVHVIGAGTDHLTGAGLPEHNVVVTNSSGVAARSIAEYVVGRLLMIWKRFPEQAELQRQKLWSPTYGRTIGGSTIGIVGVGAI